MDSMLKRLLQSVGGGVFKTCYPVIQKDYNKADKRNIDAAIEAYGLSKGLHYSEKSIIAKRNAACKIFELGKNVEVLEYCQKSDRI